MDTLPTEERGERPHEPQKKIQMRLGHVTEIFVSLLVTIPMLTFANDASDRAL
jgi:hypothetical protein